MHVRDITIVGAGPAGLATAIAAKRVGLNYSIIEKGVLVNSIFKFPVNMVFFTTPELLEIGGLPLVSPFEKPTRVEALKYYRRVVDTYDLQIDFGEQVVSVSSAGSSGIFDIETRTDKGVRKIRQSRNVVFAIGYFDHPNYIGVPGENLPHVSHYYSEPHLYWRKDVVVIGGKNSAAEAALDLFRAGTRVTLVHRHAELGSTIKYWVRPDIENRLKAGEVKGMLATRVTRIEPQQVWVTSASNNGGASGEERPIGADAVFALTGYHPDFDFLRALGIQLDPATNRPAMNPETHESNVPGIYLAGVVIGGNKTGEIFIENGRFHGKQIVRALTGAG
jgi:thioredoxin reductase (NADPH)